MEQRVECRPHGGCEIRGGALGGRTGHTNIMIAVLPHRTVVLRFLSHYIFTRKNAVSAVAALLDNAALSDTASNTFVSGYCCGRRHGDCTDERYYLALFATHFISLYSGELLPVYTVMWVDFSRICTHSRD